MRLRRVQERGAVGSFTMVTRSTRPSSRHLREERHDHHHQLPHHQLPGDLRNGRSLSRHPQGHSRRALRHHHGGGQHRPHEPDRPSGAHRPHRVRLGSTGIPRPSRGHHHRPGARRAPPRPRRGDHRGPRAPRDRVRTDRRSGLLGGGQLRDQRWEPHAVAVPRPRSVHIRVPDAPGPRGARGHGRTRASDRRRGGARAARRDRRVDPARRDGPQPVVHAPGDERRRPRRVARRHAHGRAAGSVRRAWSASPDRSCNRRTSRRSPPASASTEGLTVGSAKLPE